MLDAREENEGLSSTNRIADIVKHHQVDLIYVNTVAALDLADEFKKACRRPVILHVRELEMAIRQFAGLELFQDALRYVDAYINAAIVGTTNLVKNHNIPPERVHRLPSGIPLSEVPKPSPEEQDEIRRSLRIPTGSFIVGGSGDLNWWKSPDVFVQVARYVIRAETDRQVHFVWVGGHLTSREFELLLHDIRALELDDRVHFVGTQAHTRRYFSREPLPQPASVKTPAS